MIDMKKNCRMSFALLVTATAAALLTTPVLALAEEADDNISAADILLPNPAEFIPALVAFIVIWAVLAHFVWPSVTKTLDLREQTIQDNLDAAEKNKLETERAYKKAQDEIDAAQNEADDIVAAAKKQADASRAAILDQVNKDAKRIADKARENIEIERQNATTDLTDQAASLAVDLAQKIVEKELDPQTQEHLIQQALKEAEATEGVS